MWKRRQKAEGPKRGMRNAEWGNLDSGVLDKGLGCRALRLLGRNGEIRESGGKVTAWFFPQPRSIESRGWPQAGRDHGSVGASPYRLGEAPAKPIQSPTKSDQIKPNPTKRNGPARIKAQAVESKLARPSLDFGRARWMRGNAERMNGRANGLNDRNTCLCARMGI